MLCSSAILRLYSCIPSTNPAHYHNNVSSQGRPTTRTFGTYQLFLSPGASFSKKIATLFWISATNFVFPVILSVAQLVALLVIPSRYDIALCINEVNIHISIIAVVFATVWVFEGRWAETHGLVVTTVPAASQFSAMRFGVAGTYRDGGDERATKQTHISEKAQDTMESTSSSMHFAASSPDSMQSDVERGKGGNAFQVVVV